MLVVGVAVGASRRGGRHAGTNDVGAGMQRRGGIAPPSADPAGVGGKLSM